LIEKRLLEEEHNFPVFIHAKKALIIYKYCIMEVIIKHGTWFSSFLRAIQ